MSDQLLKILQLALLAVGGGWALFVFTVQRRFAAMIEFTVDAHVYRHESGDHILETILLLKNYGAARQKVTSIRLTVRGIRASDDLEPFGSDSVRLAFPATIVTKEKMFPARLGFTFVDPGVAQQYTHVARLQKAISVILVHGEFKYRNGWKHTAERAFKVDQLLGLEHASA